MPTISQVSGYVAANRDELFSLVQKLVRCSSENTPPIGAESDVQQLIATRLRAAGSEPDVYELSEVSGLTQHRLFHPGRDYRGIFIQRMVILQNFRNGFVCADFSLKNWKI